MQKNKNLYLEITEITEASKLLTSVESYIYAPFIFLSFCLP